MRFDRTVASVPQRISKSQDLYFGLARIAERNGNTQKARKAYLQILEQNPEHADSLHRMAVTSIQLEQLDEALDYFDRAMSIDEPTSELLGDLGYALYLSGDLDSATSKLARALRMDPQNERIRNNLALAYGKQGNYDQAYELFQQSGDEAQALSNLAFIQSQAGDVRFAKQNYHRALELDPTLSVAANGLFEIHKAFPSDDPTRIKPYIDGDQPTQLVDRHGEVKRIEDLIASISDSPRGPDMNVVQAKFDNQPSSDSQVIPASFEKVTEVIRPLKGKRTNERKQASDQRPKTNDDNSMGSLPLRSTAIIRTFTDSSESSTSKASPPIPSSRQSDSTR